MLPSIFHFFGEGAGKPIRQVRYGGLEALRVSGLRPQRTEWEDENLSTHCPFLAHLLES